MAHYNEDMFHTHEIEIERERERERSPSSSLQGFRRSFSGQLGDWKTYYDDREPHKAALPAPWGERLTDFQKMIVLRCLRPDKVCV